MCVLKARRCGKDEVMLGEVVGRVSAMTGGREGASGPVTEWMVAKV